MTEGDLLHAVGVGFERGKVGGPALRPALEVSHTVIDLKRMNTEEVEVYEEWERFAEVHGGLACAELGFNSIKEAAVIPVVCALAEGGAGVGLALKSPKHDGVGEPEANGSG